VDTLGKMHGSVRWVLNLSKEFVLHSLRHTMLIRFCESGADAFTIMRVAGHSNVVVSQWYIHPQSGVGRARISALGSVEWEGQRGGRKKAQLVASPYRSHYSNSICWE